MRRAQLVMEIADLKKRQAIKNAHLLHIEKTTNWQGELYNSNRDALFEITEQLDKKMDEYYFVCKSEIIQIDSELSKIQDALLADPFDYNALIVQEKDAKGKRLEIWHEMKEVLWVHDSNKYPLVHSMASVQSAINGVANPNPKDWSVKTTMQNGQLVDWEIVGNDRIRRECEDNCQNPECLQTTCIEHQNQLTKEAEKSEVRSQKSEETDWIVVKYFDDHHDGVIQSGLTENEAREKATELNSLNHKPFTSYQARRKEANHVG